MPKPFSARRFHLAGTLLLVSFGCCLLLVLGSCTPRQAGLLLGSGPRGGTFENIAAGLRDILNQSLPETIVTVTATAGSVANLKQVEQGKLDLGLVFAGDAFLGYSGQLTPGLPPTGKVLTLARLYGATLQLVVPNSSAIQTVADLSGRRVAIGNPGSGATQAAQRYFQAIGLWQRIIPIHEGYLIAMEDMLQGNIDAVWLQVGVPSEYLLQVDEVLPLRFLNLVAPAESKGFFERYPFYSRTTIPAGTYVGQLETIGTFEDSALWVANAGVSADWVYQALTALFSEAGLQQLRTGHPAAVNLALNNGLLGVSTPLHPGALRFWQERGIQAPPLRPKETGK